LKDAQYEKPEVLIVIFSVWSNLIVMKPNIVINNYLNGNSFNSTVMTTLLYIGQTNRYNITSM